MLYSCSRGSRVLIVSVSVVLRLELIVTLHSRSVVAREGDSYSLIESSLVHLPFVGLVGFSYYRKHTLPVFSLVISLDGTMEDIAYQS